MLESQVLEFSVLCFSKPGSYQPPFFFLNCEAIHRHGSQQYHRNVLISITLHNYCLPNDALMDVFIEALNVYKTEGQLLSKQLRGF